MQQTEKQHLRLDSAFYESQADEIANSGPTINTFALGDPEPMLDSNPMDYLGVFASANESYFIPPVSLNGLSQILNSNGNHRSVIGFKNNQLTSLFNDNSMIAHTEFCAAVLDYETFSNAYFLAIRNRFNTINRYVRLPALNMRVGTNQNYFYLKNDGSETEYSENDILHIKGNDVRQNIYGLPEYFAGVQSILLGEAATLFRRKFYNNGAHAGYILATYDLDATQATGLKDAIKNTKGPGNYRSVYLNMKSTIGGKPGITKDRIQLIPIGEIGNNDEYEKVKSVTMQDILNVHRVPAPLASIMPSNAGGFGDLQNIREVYYDAELLPMQRVWKQLNEKIPARGRVSFNEPRWLEL